MYANNRDTYRDAFFIAWQKYQAALPLQPIESALVTIMLQHPEYHTLLNKPSDYAHQEFAIEENPFFHMSLHLSLREQVNTNRPAGIVAIQQKLLAQYAAHDCEHKMMTCLAKLLWQAQETGVTPTDELYLEKLQAL